MKKNRYYHLSYCSVCTNRTSNLQNGIICNLTNKQADFTDICPNYILDTKKIEKVNSDISFKIENNLCNGSSNLNPNLEDGWKFYPLKQSSSSKYKSMKDTHGLKIGNNKLLTYILLGVSTFPFIWFIKAIINNEIEAKNFKEIAITFSILTVLPLLFGLKELFNKKIYFETSDKLMKLNEHIIAWNDILIVGYSQHLLNTGNSGTNLVLGTKSKGLIFTKIDNVNINRQEIADIIFLNQNNNA
ncbi:MAG: hypothetical protein P8Q14_08270 [Vicingaceae bacterium]|nr:hypothetical protein [Vicingaceae bacterium]